jgi:hypothetical protein
MHQFLSLQQYPGGRVKALLGEADRRHGSTRHLDSTYPPTWTAGSARQVEDAARTYRKTAKDRIGRKIRIDSPLLLAGVVSIPISMDQLPHVELNEDWHLIDTSNILSALSTEIHLIQAWLHDQWDHLSVAWHFDESHPHCHFFSVGNCKVLHPGVAATYQLATGMRLEIGKKAASRQAMVDLQDHFHLEVGAQLGWTRKSDHPRPRISSRRTYFAEQERARLLAADAAEWESRTPAAHQEEEGQPVTTHFAEGARAQFSTVETPAYEVKARNPSAAHDDDEEEEEDLPAPTA